MPVLKLGNFTGIIPRTGKRYLPDNAAQTAKNTKLFSGEIRSWMKPSVEYQTKQPNAVSIFKMHGPGTRAQWLEWTVDTDVVRGPVADAEDHRIYYSEDGVCKKTNWELATGGTGTTPHKWLHMGVPSPKGALTLTAERTKIESTETPGTMIYDADNTENRAYVYTYVSTFGAVKEESSPSQAADVVCDIVGHPVKVSGFVNPPTENYNITHIRLYRVVTGSETATYMLVDEFELDDHKFPASGTTLNEVKWSNSTYEDAQSVTKLGKELDTLNFTPPPEGLRGLVSMPNGYLAGFTYNQVWFSEPYLPYAWPSDYMLTVDSQIVGLGVYGNTLVVCTMAQPYTISGTHPSSMTQEKQPMNQPCVSKASIAYDQYGVLYASPHGLVALAGGQMDVFTRSLMSRDEWQEYAPSLMHACMYNNMYVASYHVGDERGLLILSRGDTPAMVTMDFSSTTLHVEYGTGALYGLNAIDHCVYLIDGSDINRMTYEWKSKEFAFNYRNTFSCAKVEAEYGDINFVKEWEEARQETIKYNEQVWETKGNRGLQGSISNAGMCEMALNGSLMKHVPNASDVRAASITFFADGQPFYTKTLANSESFRIPAVSGYSWEVRVAGTLSIHDIVLGTSMSEVNSI